MALWSRLVFLLVYRSWLPVLVIMPMLGAVGLAVTVGADQPDPVPYLVAGDCAQPCWRGLQPGQSSQDDVLAAAQQRGLVMPGSLELGVDRASATPYIYWRTSNLPSYGVRASFEASTLQRLDLDVQRSLRLGDLVDLFGTPTHATLCPRVIAGYAVLRSSTYATLYYRDGLIEVLAMTPYATSQRLRTDMQVLRITYHASPDRDVTTHAARWQGFGRLAYSRAAVCR
jgi:hypothetical protein